MADNVDRDATALALRIAEFGAGERTRVYRMSFWSERLLSWAMANPEFKTQLFRFVDVFPAMRGDRDVARHIEEYFDNVGAPRLLQVGVGLAERARGMGRSVSASVARRNIRRMAEQFIVGVGPSDAAAGLHRLWRAGSAFTVDLLGEKTVTEAEADGYAGRVRTLLDALVQASSGWAPDDLLEFDDLGRLPRVNVSIKPTALASLYAPLTRDRAVQLRHVVFVVVNSGLPPQGEWAQTVQGPSGKEMIGAITDTAINSAVRSGFDAFRLTVKSWEDATRKWRCALSRGEAAKLGATSDWRCSNISFEVVEINFSQLDPARAARLDRVPTSFHLPEEVVDLVAQAGTDALLAHPTVRAVLGRAN